MEDKFIIIPIGSIEPTDPIDEKREFAILTIAIQRKTNYLEGYLFYSELDDNLKKLKEKFLNKKQEIIEYEKNIWISNVRKITCTFEDILVTLSEKIFSDFKSEVKDAPLKDFDFTKAVGVSEETESGIIIYNILKKLYIKYDDMAGTK